MKMDEASKVERKMFEKEVDMLKGMVNGLKEVKKIQEDRLKRLIRLHQEYNVLRIEDKKNESKQRKGK